MIWIKHEIQLTSAPANIWLHTLYCPHAHAQIHHDPDGQLKTILAVTSCYSHVQESCSPLLALYNSDSIIWTHTHSNWHLPACTWATMQTLKLPLSLLRVNVNPRLVLWVIFQLTMTDIELTVSVNTYICALFLGDLVPMPCSWRLLWSSSRLVSFFYPFSSCFVSVFEVISKDALVMHIVIPMKLKGVFFVSKLVYFVWRLPQKCILTIFYCKTFGKAPTNKRYSTI